MRDYRNGLSLMRVGVRCLLLSEPEPAVRSAWLADRRSPGSPAASDERVVIGRLTGQQVINKEYRQDELKMALVKLEEGCRFYNLMLVWKKIISKI